MSIKKFNDFRKFQLPQDVIDISIEYIKNNKEIFVVGGAVRDFIMGIEPKDYDLVTNALPEESIKILKKFNVSDEQGKSFGVIRVFTKDEPEGYEIASYRRDISLGRDTKGDDQKVEMGKNVTMEDDCNRRDLAINALYYDIKNDKIIDLVGGIDDIKNNIIRAVGNPSERFIEDRLRICRIFRFASRTQSKIDTLTSESIKKDNRLRNVSVKEDVSQERIWDEFKKSFKQSKDFNFYLNLLTEYDMWEEMFPNSNINKDFIKSNNFLMILVNLFKLEDTSKLEKKLVQDYKIESDLSKKIIFFINLFNFDSDNVFDIYKKKVQCGVSSYDIIPFFDTFKNEADYNSLIKFSKYKPSVSSEELMKQGFKGKELGEEIKRIESEIFKNY